MIYIWQVTENTTQNEGFSVSAGCVSTQLFANYVLISVVITACLKGPETSNHKHLFNELNILFFLKRKKKKRKLLKAVGTSLPGTFFFLQDELIVQVTAGEIFSTKENSFGKILCYFTVCECVCSAERGWALWENSFPLLLLLYIRIHLKCICQNPSPTTTLSLLM